MNKAIQHLIFFLGILHIATFIQAQSQLQSFDSFFSGEMKKTEGLFPVYRTVDRVFLEIPRAFIGREVEVRAQIDRGFDMINRPVESLGVICLSAPDSLTISFQRPFYNERMPAVNNPNRAAFALSNVQHSGIPYSIVSYSPNGGAIIEITKQLLSGDDWFNYQFSFMRALLPELSKVTHVHPFEEGVSFTLQRYHGSESSENVFSNLAMSLPVGNLPIELTCVLRLLPEKKDNIRLANRHVSYQTIRFKDYDQDPYGIAEDSLILRWHLDRPLIFYIDSLFPKEYLQSVERGILDWNKAFREAGLGNILQVKSIDKSECSAEQHALVSYDLRLPGVTGKLMHHPRTGEILSCRLNIGHGFLQDKLDDYLLCCGATDARIMRDRLSKEVERELLQSEVTRQVGFLLGLAENTSGSATRSLAQLKKLNDADKNAYSSSIMDVLPYNFISEGKGMALTIGEEDRLAIRFGYTPLKQSKSCYDDRERLSLWLHSIWPNGRELVERPKHALLQAEGDLSNNPSGACAIGLEHLQTTLRQLPTFVRKESTKDNALPRLYKKGLHLYADYLKRIAAAIGSTQSAEEQHQAMLDLKKFLFQSDTGIGNAFLKRNWPELENQVLLPAFRELFSKLLSEETLAALRLQAIEGKPYDEEAFFHDLYDGLFCNFDSSVSISYSQMDIQLLAIKMWMENVRKNEVTNRAIMFRLESALYDICKKMEALSHTHSQEEVRRIYGLLSRHTLKQLKGGRS